MQASRAAPWFGANVSRPKRAAPGHAEVPVRRYRGVRKTRSGTYEVILKGKNGAVSVFRFPLMHEPRMALQVPTDALATHRSFAMSGCFANPEGI